MRGQAVCMDQWEKNPAESSKVISLGNTCRYKRILEWYIRTSGDYNNEQCFQEDGE